MIKVSYQNGKYTVPVIINNDPVELKFDTGAQNTVISIKRLFPLESKERLQNICNTLQKYPSQSFVLANGSEIKGIWCAIKDIEIGDVKLSKFYFNLILDIDNKIALLGDDFIAGCKFEHEIGGNINISAINNAWQMSIIKDQNIKALELNSLECELQEMES